jgi:hypothetical protein
LPRPHRDRPAGRRQAFVTVEDTTGRFHASHGQVEPAGPHIWSEPKIVAGLAKATLRDDSHVNWDAWSDDYALVRDAIAATYPQIFADFNTRILATRKGFDRPIAARQRKWNTKSGKANFIAPPCLSEDPDLPQRRDGVLTLITVRSNDQFNTTVYGYEDRLRGIYGTREVVLMHEADMRSLGIADGEIVDIIGDAGDGVERQVLGFRDALRRPAWELRRLLSRMQSVASPLASRRPQPRAGREVDPGADSQAQSRRLGAHRTPRGTLPLPSFVPPSCSCKLFATSLYEHQRGFPERGNSDAGQFEFHTRHACAWRPPRASLQVYFPDPIRGGLSA